MQFYKQINENFLSWFVNIIVTFIAGSWLAIKTITGCNIQHTENNKVPLVKNDCSIAVINKNDLSKYYTTQDTVIIAAAFGDTLEYSRAEFNKIIDEHPDFFQKYIYNPDQLYHNGNDSGQFGSEVGQDNYYELYAYFLKQKNGIEKYDRQRKKLIDIYSNINSLFSYFEYGGTYFEHQSRRIVGYAEYSISIMPGDSDHLHKKYDIARQKALYIQALRQLIADESTIDFNSMGKDKTAKHKLLNAIVDEIDRSITSNFYLRRAKEFSMNIMNIIEKIGENISRFFSKLSHERLHIL